MLFNSVIPPTPVIVTCWPSLNLFADVITIGSACVAPVIVALSVVDTDWTVAVAPEVLPVTVSPVVNACAVLMFKCVNKTISKR